MSVNKMKIIEDNLSHILNELETQSDIGKLFPPEKLSFQKTIDRLREWIEDAGEYGIAYESIIAMLEKNPFVLSGIAAVKLLEVGLLFKFKTEDEQDKIFDSRI